MKYSPALDGLRGVSALAVVLLHISYGHFHGGFLGVDVFFAISGYLITGILLGDVDAFSRIRFGHFYAGRARRLLPALVVGLVLAWILWPKNGPGYTGAALPTLFYYANWKFVMGGADSMGPLSPAWSLAIEEQFYLVWPFVLLLLVNVLRRRQYVFLATVSVAGALMVARAALFAKGSSLASYASTLARMDEILIGGAVAMKKGCFRGHRWWAYLSVVSLLVAGFFAYTSSTWLFVGGFSAYAFCATVLVDFIVTTPNDPLSRILGSVPLVEVGKRSYGLYLFHLPIVLALERFRVPHSVPNFVTVALAKVALALAVAWLSYSYVELPFRRRRVPVIGQPEAGGV